MLVIRYLRPNTLRWLTSLFVLLSLGCSDNGVENDKAIDPTAADASASDATVRFDDNDVDSGTAIPQDAAVLTKDTSGVTGNPGEDSVQVGAIDSGAVASDSGSVGHNTTDAMTADAGTSQAADSVDDASVTDAGSASTPMDTVSSDVGTTGDAGGGQDGSGSGPDISGGGQPDAGGLPGDTGSAPSGAMMAGCSDGSREGFVDEQVYPMVAGCQGAWTIKGIHHGIPACKRQSGNTGLNPAGQGCNVEDLCAPGWHVCFGAKDVLERNPLGCGGILDVQVKEPKFFLARTSSTGAFNCSQDSTKFGSPGTSNDLFGCGNLGCSMNFKTYPTCNPLNRASHNLCKGLRNDKGCGDWCSHLGKFAGEPNVWDCGTNSTLEANNVVKKDPTRQGGVLCCSDSNIAPPNGP